MHSFNIIGAHLVLPDRILEHHVMTVRDGIISSISPDPEPDLASISFDGLFLLPGFIDIHLHGGGGADFMDGSESAIRTVCETHLQHGTTALVPTTMTCPDSDLEHFIRLFLQVKRSQALPSSLLGLHLEGPFFSPASRGAQPVGNIRIPDAAFLNRILSLAEGEILRWDAAPELENMQMFAETMLSHDVLPAIAHTNAVADEAELAFTWGFSHITHFYNAVTTYRKMPDTRNYAGVVEAAYLHDEVTLELIGDGRHVPRQSLLLARKIKGADRIALITDAMRAAGTDARTSILGSIGSNNVVDIFDGVAQVPDHSSYAGSIATMDHVLRIVHLTYGVPLPEVSRMMSLTPARLSKADKRKGSLTTGKDADFLIFSPDFLLQKVFVAGDAIL